MTAAMTRKKMKRRRRTRRKKTKRRRQGVQRVYVVVYPCVWMGDACVCMYVCVDEHRRGRMGDINDK